MSVNPTFLCQQGTFFYRGQAFVPRMKGSLRNTSLIALPAGSDADLSWETAIERAREEVQGGRYVFWQFVWNIEVKGMDVFDTGLFSCLTLAIEHFSRLIWPEFAENTFGILIYRGPLDPFDAHVDRAMFDDWVQDEEISSLPDRLRFAIYRVHLFAQYLHRLVSFFPENALVCSSWDRSEWTDGETLLLLSLLHRSHTCVCVDGALVPGIYPRFDEQYVGASGVGLGLCMPSMAHWNSCWLSQWTEVVNELTGQQFRCLEEEKLNEQWEGINQLIVFPEYLTGWGARMVQGFLATGGELITVGESETHLGATTLAEWNRKNRSRGIRTPDLLLPKQPR